MAHERADRAPVEPHRHERSVPADGVERVESERLRAERPAALDHHAAGGIALLRAERVVDLRHVEHRGIEHRVLACDAALGEPVAVAARFDEQRRKCTRRVDAPHRAARKHHVVAVAQREMAIIAIQVAVAFVHEQQLVAIAVAHEVVHGTGRAPEADTHVRVGE
jgi:hypothetical protein